MFKWFKKKKKATGFMMEKEVLSALDISDFRHITKDKIMEFTTLIPKMEQEVVKTALNQFPHFAKMTSEVIVCYKEIMGQALKQNQISTQNFYDSCDSVIAALNSLLEKDKIKKRERKKIVENILEIVKIKDKKDTENKIFLIDMVKGIGVTAVALVSLITVIINPWKK